MTDKTDAQIVRETLEAQRDTAVLERDEVQARIDAATEALAAPAVKPDPVEARKKELEARRAATVAAMEGVTAGVDTIRGAALTLPEKSVFREAYVSDLALKQAAAKVADAIGPRAYVSPLLITSSVTQAREVIGAAVFSAGVDAFAQAAQGALQPRVIDRLETVPADPGDAADIPGSIAGAVVGLAVAALNTLTVETTVDAAQRTASEFETHAAVMRALITRWTHPQLMHESISVPRVPIGLLARFRALAATVPLLTARSADLKRQIEEREPKEKPEVGPRADADPRKNANERADSEPVGDEEGDVTAGSPIPDDAQGSDQTELSLDDLKAEKGRVDAVESSVSAFVVEALAVDPTTSTSPLVAALATHAKFGDVSGPNPGTGVDVAAHVAVVTPARINAHQVALKRRLFAPRLVVSASAAIDVMVLDVKTGRIVAAGLYSHDVVMQVRFPMAWFGGDDKLAPQMRNIAG